jgi:hypothetical protein
MKRFRTDEQLILVVEDLLVAYDARSRVECYEKPPNQWVVGRACRPRRSLGGIKPKVGDTVKSGFGV